ncbi:MarR family winged helix-turn-helix transcriptional regulator [Terrilactibacillus laevilacticus]|uniref:MarR family winged helix-turn-helix transcriptional regulator n=1 Tax=Terrilactibacillus laevilacticus TaxID=1380157 RepID=A0ABW5PRU7_9BACI|nr:MarR family winged helix-turn-helix transcriptional regulator [Terrilactibacillus laevilacticus]
MAKEPIGKLIAYISRQNQKILSKELRPFNIGGGGQHSFLKTILMNPGINQDRLTTKLKYDKATTARSVKQLERNGYIERVTNQNDRRSNLLFPTQKAKDFYPTFQKILDRSNRKLTKLLTNEEEDQLIVLLQKICKHGDI